LEGLHRKASGGVTVFLIIADNRLEYFCENIADVVAAPANWQAGDPTVISTNVRDLNLKVRFGSFSTLTSYLHKANC
jgi:hypothetical protein